MPTHAESHDLPECGVCGDPVVGPENLACSRCSTPHHPDCWRFNEGCSIFGCGSTDSLPLASLVADLHARGLTITETTRPPMRLFPLVEGLARKLRTRARYLPGTVAAGLAGGTLAIAAAHFFRIDVAHKEWLVVCMLGSGGLHGLLAPFLAPRQLRAPRRSAAAGLAALVLAFLVTEWAGKNAVGYFFLTLSLTGGMFFASSLSEILVGFRSRIGELLGPLAPVLRAGVAWLGLALGIVLLSTVEDGRLPHLEFYFQALVLGLMGMAAAVPAMEQGKAAYLNAVSARRRIEGDPS